MNTYAVIVAAGKSVRFGGGTPKQFAEICGRPLLSWTISRFEKAASIDAIVLVVAEESLVHAGENIVDRYDFQKVRKVVAGGATRRESVLNGLNSLPNTTELVAIHDGARPLVKPVDIDRVVETAASEGAAMLAVCATDTVKRVKDGIIEGTVDRDSLYLAQTPQVFRYERILSAHHKADPNVIITDDASLLEVNGVKVHIVEPTGTNLKVTTADDMLIVEALLEREKHD
jgi:2-C-methyl-D-erythritol 4-phosphate cytidylyltransferase